jgi:uncharacterized protein YpmB
MENTQMSSSQGGNKKGLKVVVLVVVIILVLGGVGAFFYKFSSKQNTKNNEANQTNTSLSNLESAIVQTPGNTETIDYIITFYQETSREKALEILKSTGYAYVEDEQSKAGTRTEGMMFTVKVPKDDTAVFISNMQESFIIDINEIYPAGF